MSGWPPDEVSFAVGSAEPRAGEEGDGVAVDELVRRASDWSREVVAGRRGGERARGRGWLVRRMLLGADVLGLIVAFSVAQVFLGHGGQADPTEWFFLAGAIPLWIVMGKLYGLYDRDDARAAHSTVDDVVAVFHLVTVGAWLLFLAGRVTGVDEPAFWKLAGFWLLAIVLIIAGRAAGRAIARRSALYVQNTLIVGAGDVGQLVARKVLQHPEYGINLVGFLDEHPRALRPELSGVPLLGPTSGLVDFVRALNVDRVLVAFSDESELATVDLIRSLCDDDVQIDIVPRLFEVVGPKVTHHSIEAMPLTGLPPVRLSRSSRAVKRLIDIVGAAVLLLATAPVFLVVAVLIRRDSEGPIFFRQVRLGLNMRRFTALKFRTMYVNADEAVHREYIRQTMSASANVGDNGIYKLTRDDVTNVGRWLRRTSLDELPQLLNVLRGDMSLVGPRPCIPYETELFKSYQFERFLVPAGLTGLWQVAARAHATFGEALDMDVAYARGWTLGLDLQLLCRTPLEILRPKGTS
jgi:exopolysaccharide biosynthesis polyprenyl glycosylphosphotransferase